MKNLSNLCCAFLLSTVLLVLHASASADICGEGYSRSERELILSQQTRIDEILLRMGELAQLSALASRKIETIAYNEEFTALRAALDEYAHSPLSSSVLSARTVQFLDAILDPQFLKISGITLTADALDQAQSNARDALNIVNAAVAQVHQCLHGSYDQIALSGEANDGRCAGGFTESEWRIVADRYVAARDILLELKRMALSSSTAVLSVDERIASQADFIFFVQDIQLNGDTQRRVTRRTRRFLKNVFSPVFLGLNDLRVAAETITESQTQAQRSLSAIESALKETRRCVLRMR